MNLVVPHGCPQRGVVINDDLVQLVAEQVLHSECFTFGNAGVLTKVKKSGPVSMSPATGGGDKRRT